MRLLTYKSRLFYAQRRTRSHYGRHMDSLGRNGSIETNGSVLSSRSFILERNEFSINFVLQLMDLMNEIMNSTYGHEMSYRGILKDSV